MAAPRGASSARLAMQLVMAAAAVWWLLYWVFQPIPTTKAWLTKIDKQVASTFQGTRGSLFLLQMLPILVIAFLSYFVLELRRRLTKPSAKEVAEGRKPRINIWSLPIFVRSPFFGMLTAGDICCILVILFVVWWYFIKYTVTYVDQIDQKRLKPGDDPRSLQKLEKIGHLFGNTAVIPIALLWIPVSRGSAILQVIGVPFERAVKYHTWLGYLAVWLLILHGILLTGYFISTHDTIELITWYNSGQGIGVVEGVVALAAGVIMMLTALEPVRRKFFDLFFTAHHFYLVFLLFFGFHCVGRVMYIIIPVLIFFMDRFMRAVQSRKAVDVLSAKVHKSGIIELKFAKTTNSTYHALSFLYVKLPSVSWLRWHPFSVASSPLDGTNEISIFIKPLGGFTKNLHDALISSHNSQSGRDFYKCPFSYKVGLDGPYGDESAFYLRYKKLVLVAGGIGVTPFLAIIRDILHRYRLNQEDLPSAVQLIYCIRSADELHILDAIAPSSVLPGYEEHLTITVDAYVTSRSATEQDDTTSLPGTHTDVATSREMNYTNTLDDSNLAMSFSSAIGSQPREMFPISSSGHAIWVAATFAVTIVGFFLINGMFNLTVLKTNPLTNYDRVFIYIAAIIIAVVVCGGGVMLLWAFVEKRAAKQQSPRVTSQSSRAQSPAQDSKLKDIETAAPSDELWQGNVTYGRRPNWKDYFGNVALTHQGQDVGVLVSGGSKMQEDVASECRRRTLSRESTVVMHYHSVSFEL
ncbi:unnamed protein product [Calypogeia fissa]